METTEPTKTIVLTTLSNTREREKKKVQLVQFLAPALTLDHLANKPQWQHNGLLMFNKCATYCL